jgi:hypothetical protein
VIAGHLTSGAKKADEELRLKDLTGIGLGLGSGLGLGLGLGIALGVALRVRARVRVNKNSDEELRLKDLTGIPSLAVVWLKLGCTVAMLWPYHAIQCM